jgi:glycosyltransferase involved in cell wall biosynthesis
MSSELTVITPIAPRHRALYKQAADSVLAQTVPVRHIARVDERGEGPGAIRNRLLEQVDTEYVAFLDADDWIDPTFAATTLAAMRPDRYVYTDWWKDDEKVRVPAAPWCTGNFHLVTAVVPTEAARAIGGFDEDLPGMEDTDFYLRLLLHGVCGIHIKEPLVHYRADGGRASHIHESGEVDRLQGILTARYGGKSVSCCGDIIEVDNTPVNERRDGDVLAMAKWGGNATQNGLVSGRLYPRTSYPKQVWVDPRDVKAAPHHWELVIEEVPAVVIEKAASNGHNGDHATELLSGVEALVAGLVEADILEEAPAPLGTGPIVIQPDFATVARLAREAVGK